MQYQKTSTCYRCGKQIKFVRASGASKATPVEPNMQSFRPDPTGDDFYMTNGQINTGVSAPDGVFGYKPHICDTKNVQRRYQPRQLSEKEMARRRWA